MAGFAAACYQRGVDFVQVPTTLLAQVDSSVGGKTGVNHPRGKNMIGAFHQPRAVIADTDTLGTLPDRELAAGLAEVVKYGLIRDPAFFDWLEANRTRLLARDADALAEAIERSCRNKAEVVAADERESGQRALLNLGHTFGHAIEAGMGYGAWLHGEAVAAGMVLAAELSHSLEVAQVARTAARVLGLSEPLSEAISLAHDLGHTPFGHAGQDALNDCMRAYGGFEHNLQSLRVVDELEERYAGFAGLNLTFECREGILKHCSVANARGLGDVGLRFLERQQPSLEAQLANLADAIAYNNHDVDDGVRAGLITLDELASIPLFARHQETVLRQHPGQCLACGRDPGRYG
jgi:hypothetical protein